MAQGYSCTKCDRAFSMAAHLARHMNTIHSRGAKAAKKKAAKAVKKRTAKAGKKRTARAGAKRKVKVRRGKRIGRPSGLVARLGLRNMSVDQLAEVIEAARAEGRQKIRAMQGAF